MDLIVTAGSCVKLCYNIFQIVKSVGNVHKDIGGIHTEISQLSIVLDSVKTTFSEPIAESEGLGSQTGHAGDLWNNLGKALQDCQGTLQRFENLLQDIQKPKAAVFSRPRTSLNLFLKSDDVARLREKIRHSHLTINVALQAITMYSPKTSMSDCDRFYAIKIEGSSATTSTRLDNLSKMIKRVLRMLTRWESATPVKLPEDIRVMKNLGACAQSADVLVQDATTILHSGSSTAGSVIDQDPEGRETAQKWIPMEEIGEEKEEETEALPRYESHDSFSVRSGIPHMDQSELALIEHWRNDALLKYNARRYEEAEKPLENILQLSENSQLWCRDEILEMLACSYQFQKKWHLAEELLRVDFNGKDEILVKLAKSYCFHCKWREAENLVQNFSFTGRRRIVTHLATAFLRSNMLKDGIRILHDNAEDDMELKPEGSEMLHIISQLYLASKNYAEALSCCSRAIRGRAMIFGEYHVLYYQSIRLRVDIYEEINQWAEAKVSKRFLPENYQGRLLDYFFRHDPNRV
jgi:tetratricopeptide (TPR) repeat protein